MNKEKDVFENEYQFTVTTCAILFGCDQSLENFNLGRGFIIKKMSLIPWKDNLDQIFKIDAMGLRREYEGAIVDGNLEVMCIYKREIVNMRPIDVEPFFNKISDEILVFLDDKIRSIRLLYEGAIRFQKLAIECELKEKFFIGIAETSIKRSIIIPIEEAQVTNEISRISFLDKEKVEREISKMQFPFQDRNLNNCHAYYDLSYHQENFISITLLNTCLEILFVDNENYKAEKLAKRCAMYIYSENKEIKNCFSRLKNLYKKRSNFVHDGKRENIENEDIIYLRQCVRLSLLKYLKEKKTKKENIKYLKNVISKNQNLFS